MREITAKRRRSFIERSLSWAVLSVIVRAWKRTRHTGQNRTIYELKSERDSILKIQCWEKLEDEGSFVGNIAKQKSEFGWRLFPLNVSSSVYIVLSVSFAQSIHLPLSLLFTIYSLAFLLGIVLLTTRTQYREFTNFIKILLSTGHCLFDAPTTHHIYIYISSEKIFLL